jgi:hypothetical protein
MLPAQCLKHTPVYNAQHTRKPTAIVCDAEQVLYLRRRVFWCLQCSCKLTLYLAIVLYTLADIVLVRCKVRVHKHTASVPYLHAHRGSIQRITPLDLISTHIVERRNAHACCSQHTASQLLYYILVRNQNHLFLYVHCSI